MFTLSELYHVVVFSSLSLCGYTKFYRSPFKPNLVFSFLLHSTNTHHIVPQGPALYQYAFRFQRELLTVMLFIAISIFLVEFARLFKRKVWSVRKVYEVHKTSSSSCLQVLYHCSVISCIQLKTILRALHIYILVG